MGAAPQSCPSLHHCCLTVCAQSPLSFGGFGALTRHLRRLTTAVVEAVEADALDAASLAAVHAYNPGLSSSWMLQRAMSVRQGDTPPTDLINRMLGARFMTRALTCSHLPAIYQAGLSTCLPAFGKVPFSTNQFLLRQGLVTADGT